MAELTEQLERLSYTRRDLDLIDAEIDRFLTSFIPLIRNTGKANVGRQFIRVIEALIDKLNYSLDMRFRQSVLRTVTELQSALDIAELIRFKPNGVSSATVDLTVTTLTGPASLGGISIPQYTIFTTETSPVKQFISLEASSVPYGTSSLYPLPVVEGIRVINQTILASANGDPNEEVQFPVSGTPHEYIEIKVDGTDYEQQTDLKDSESVDRHYYLRDDENYTTTVIFGDGEYGVKLQPGSVITATYIQSLGEGGNTAPNLITKVSGSLSSDISVTNEEAASGGYDGDTVDDIVRNAPLAASSARGAETLGADFYRASNDNDFAALAVLLVNGVFQALADDGVGPVVNLYIMPAGGGIASSTLLQSVEDTLTPRSIHGTTINAESLMSAHILVQMNVSLQTNKISKSSARKKVYEAISAFKLDGTVNSDGALYYRNLTIGRGFALSDMSALIESIDDSTLVDFVDYIVFTRYPTPIAHNDSTTVNFDGELVPSSVADYDNWSISTTSTTEFVLYKNSIIDSLGIIGVEHTSNDGSVTFTLGKTTDTFDPGVDGWAFKTSSYRNNMSLDRYEFMELYRDSDLQITIYYPGELEIGA